MKFTKLHKKMKNRLFSNKYLPDDVGESMARSIAYYQATGATDQDGKPEYTKPETLLQRIEAYVGNDDQTKKENGDA